MKGLHCSIYIFLACIACTFFACEKDFEIYSTSPNDVLSFSTDTVSFDTILTTINTPVLHLMVYNKNDKPLLISSINLKNADESGFKVNVDGESGTHFENVEIRANDSLFVKVDVKPAENGQTVPVVVNDYLQFLTNGQQQEVVLQAYGVDTYRWKGKIIDQNLTLPNDKPYLIYDSLQINEGVTLTIPEGTTFYMYNNSDIKVYGTLLAEGSLEKPVTFRGVRNDYMLNIPYDRVPGQWGGISFGSNSYNNEMDYTHIRNGQYGLYFDESDPDQSKLIIKNSVVTNVTGQLIISINSQVEAVNCEFSNSKEELLIVAGGKYNFTHCTFANYYFSSKEFGWGNSDNPTILLSNLYYSSQMGDYVSVPLKEANFYNSIVYGMKAGSTSDITLSMDTTRFPDAALNFYFRNTLIPNKGSNDDQQFVACLFNADPKFVNTGLVNSKAESTPYDFRLQKESPARNVADKAIAEKVPYDINGIDRLADEGPDMGGYEYNEEMKEIKK